MGIVSPLLRDDTQDRCEFRETGVPKSSEF
jgi:hypothetical protein